MGNAVQVTVVNDPVVQLVVKDALEAWTGMMLAAVGAPSEQILAATTPAGVRVGGAILTTPELEAHAAEQAGDHNAAAVLRERVRILDALGIDPARREPAHSRRELHAALVEHAATVAARQGAWWLILLADAATRPALPDSLRAVATAPGRAARLTRDGVTVSLPPAGRDVSWMVIMLPPADSLTGEPR